MRRIDAQDFDQQPVPTDWESVPDTDRKASPNAVRIVNDKPVIKIESGSIREAHFKNCTFELVDGASIPRINRGMNRIEVRCLWYGQKPYTTWMNVGITGRFEIIQKFTGDVTTDFGR